MPNKREPIRCFDGNAKPHEPFWKFVDAADGEEPAMELYGYISEYSWWEDDVTPKMFKDDLMRYGKGGPITIKMNSYGGDVIAASVMHSIIREYPGKITVQIDGIAASAATVVAVAADAVRMRETAYFMIHDPAAVFFMAALNIEELTQLTDMLKAVKEGIVNAYETRTGLSRARLGKLMSDETWMDARRAQDLGFVDEVMKADPKDDIPLPENAAVVNGLRNFVNVPAALLAVRQEQEPVDNVMNEAESESEPAPAMQAAPAEQAVRAEKAAQAEQAAKLRAQVKLFV